MTEETSPATCAACGSDLTGPVCALCGREAGTVTWVGSPTSPRARPRASLLIVGAVGAVFVAMIVWMWAGPPLAAPSADVRPGRLEASAAAFTSAPGSQTASESPKADTYRCWDHQERASRKSCSKPTGPSGVRWVFPGFENTGAPCKKVVYRKNTYTFECSYDGAGLIRYRYWKSKSEALDHYRKKYKGQPSRSIVVDGRTVGEMWRYGRPMQSDDLYKLSGYFMENFSFSIEAASPAQIDLLIPNLRIRHPSDYRAVSVTEGELSDFGIVW